MCHQMATEDGRIECGRRGGSMRVREISYLRKLLYTVFFNLHGTGILLLKEISYKYIKAPIMIDTKCRKGHSLLISDVPMFFSRLVQ